jgi:hypothetical protein
MLVVTYILVGTVVLLLADFTWVERISLLIMSPLFLAGFSLMVLRLEGKQARAIQALSALFGLAVLFTVLNAPVKFALLELLPPASSVGGVQTSIQMTPAIAILSFIDFALLIWNIAAMSWVYQRTLEKDAIYGTGIAVIYYIVDILMSQSLLS